MATKTNTEINGKQYFRITRTIGHKENGKPIKKQFYGSSKKDAERQYDEYLKKQAEKKYQLETEKSTRTLGNSAEEYIETVLKTSQYAKGTINRYIGEYNRHIKGTDLARTPLKDIKASTIQLFYNSLDVSQQSIKELNKFMSGFCKWLQLVGYSDNFLAAVTIPRKKDTTRHEEIVIWEDEEIKAIFDAFDRKRGEKQPHRQDFLVHLLLYSGMRISEALGLKYSDIRDGIIYVERQWYLGELKEPKWGSKRQIPMHEALIESFEEHKSWHEAEMQTNGYETEFLFTTSTGQLYHAASVRKALKRFYDAHNIPYKHPHVYRATFCTQMCRCGVPLEITSKLMGHKSLEVTAAHYALIKKDSQKEAIDKLHYDI